MEVTGQTTFTQIRAEMKETKFNRNVELRGSQDGTQLYVHGALKAHGRGEAAKLAREEKYAQGAEMIKQAIDREYGPGWGDRVFNSVRQDTGTNLDARVKRSDLNLIRDKIEALQASDAHVLNTGTSAQKLALLGTIPLNYTGATTLVQLAADQTLSVQERDVAKTLLRDKMMAMTPEQREKVLHPGGTTYATTVIDGIFTLRMSNGDRAFSVTDASTIAGDQFALQTPEEKPASFFRGNTLATKLLAAGLANLDNGRLTTLGTAIMGAVRHEIAVAQQTGESLTVPFVIGEGEAAKAQPIPNPAIMNRAITAANVLMSQQVATPELTEFLTAVKDGIESGPVPDGWDGDAYVRNAALLRGVNPGIANAIDMGAGELDYGSNIQTAIQQAVNLGRTFGPTSKFSGMNPGITALFQPNSGMNAFLDTIA